LATVEGIKKLTQCIKDLENKVKQVQRDHAKYQKQVALAMKSKSRRRRAPAAAPVGAEGGDAAAALPRKNSGFHTPVPISDEMADFLSTFTEVKRGDELARKDLTSMIHTYVVKNGLQKQGDRRGIQPNEDLQKILGNTEDNVSYFNLQTFLKKHCISKKSE
jgi:chromatin remodeling complex protein RSC6